MTPALMELLQHASALKLVSTIYPQGQHFCRGLDPEESRRSRVTKTRVLSHLRLDHLLAGALSSCCSLLLCKGVLVQLICRLLLVHLLQPVLLVELEVLQLWHLGQLGTCWPAATLLGKQPYLVSNDKPQSHLHSL